MFYTTGIMLIILLLSGVIGIYAIGWFVNILPVAAIVIILALVVQSRNPL
jgi:uncharacterized membrane protein YjdF